MSQTRFICFYSYKGGVGRSLALANLAYVLASQGRKVLILDMDLEAPGQHKTDLFRDDIGDDVPVPGILDLLMAYRDHWKNHVEQARTERPTFEWDSNDYMRRSTISELNELDGSIWLMPAGSGVNEAFQERLAEWDWDAFYTEMAGEAFLDALRWRLQMEGFDDVLIDSRTGLSDVFYISTLSLADTVVCVSGLNHQNIEGTALAIRTLSNPTNVQRYGEKRIIRLLSPVPRAFTPESDINVRKQRIGSAYPELAHWQAELPYVPHLALEERILCLEAPGAAVKDPYVLAIRELHVTLNENADKFEPDSSDEVFNPFPDLRIEYWKAEKVAEHFVDPGGNILFALRQFMPTVLFGSRGTGKTTIARWLAHDTQAFRLQHEGRQPGPKTVHRIGLWFRHDGDLLNAFNTDEEDLRPIYTRLFGQFLDILILRKALDALQTLGGIAAWCDPEELFNVLGREMDFQLIESDAASFEQALDGRLSEIRRFINNPRRASEPFITQANVLMKLLVEQLRKAGGFDDRHYFLLLIDEYEFYHGYQQRVVNMRVKQVKESDRLTYKLLARNDGIHTYETLAPDQPIEETNDFRSYSLDEEIDFDEFHEHIVKVVDTHLRHSRFFQRLGFTDPQTLLEPLAPIDEARQLFDRRGNSKLKEWLEKQHGTTAREALDHWMDTEPNPLRQTVAVLMLNQGKALQQVAQAFMGDSKKAKEWYHNYHVGALFWLISLYGQHGKRYAGLQQVVGIAGNNTRVALDLCYSIIEEWLKSSAEHELPIAADIQNRAIHERSRRYLRNLSEQGQDRDKIYLFVQRLGRLFENIHKGPRQGEPEINHFEIRGELDADTKRLLRRCQREAVLRRLPGNKQKSKPDAQRDAWQLSPRYAPAFNISWRRKKCVDLTTETLRILFSGSEEEWKRVAGDIERRYIRLGTAKPSRPHHGGQGSLL